MRTAKESSAGSSEGCTGLAWHQPPYLQAQTGQAHLRASHLDIRPQRIRYGDRQKAMWSGCRQTPEFEEQHNLHLRHDD